MAINMGSKSYPTHINDIPIGPHHYFITDWEKKFDYTTSRVWFYDNQHLPIIIGTVVYLPVLYILQVLMRNREPLKVRSALLAWNAGLAIFSLIGSLRTVPEMVYALDKFGFYHTICSTSFMHAKPSGFWVYLFVWSKIPELVDTLFLVVRKQKLTFLHVYHHSTVLMFAWCVYAHAMASARWFCAMNYSVHTVMYTYYFLKGMPQLIRLPRWISMVITSLQTLQMVVGAYVILAAYLRKLSGAACETTLPLTIIGVFIYTSYLILFVHFFYKTYCLAPRSALESSTQAPMNANDKKRA